MQMQAMLPWLYPQRVPMDIFLCPSMNGNHCYIQQREHCLIQWRDKLVALSIVQIRFGWIDPFFCKLYIHLHDFLGFSFPASIA